MKKRNRKPNLWKCFWDKRYWILLPEKEEIELLVYGHYIRIKDVEAILTKKRA